MILRSLMIAAASLAAFSFAEAADFGNTPSSRETDRGCCEPYRFVYAEVWYGNRKIVAPVRRGPAGDEVELPGEIWVPCKFSCETTLRKQSLGALESQGSGSESNVSPGYPRADSYVDGWGFRHGYLF